MAEKNNSVKAGIGYTIGNIFSKGIAFITIPIFSWIMSTSQYGIYNTFNAYLSIAAVIISLGLPASVRNVRYDFSDKEKNYHVNSLLLILIHSCVYLVMSLLFGDFFSHLLGINRFFVYVIIITATCMAIQSYYFTMLTMDYRYVDYLKLSFFYSIVSIVLSICFILTFMKNHAALGRAIGNMIPMLFIAFFIIIKICGECRKTRGINKHYSVYGLKIGLPLIPNDLASLVLMQFDRIMIFRNTGEVNAGLYSFAYNIAVIYQVIMTSIDSAWTPWLFSKLSNKEDNIIENKIVLYVLGLSVGTVILMLTSPEIIMLMSVKAYWDSKKVIVPIILAMYFWAIASIAVGMEFYYKKTGWISMCTFVTAGINVILNAIFIPQYGYIAAAYTTVFSYLIYCLFHIFAAYRLSGLLLLKNNKVLGCSLFTVGMACICVVLIENRIVRWGICFAFLLVVACFLWGKRDSIKQIIGGYLKRK